MSILPLFDTRKPRSRGSCLDNAIEALEGISEPKQSSEQSQNISTGVLLKRHKMMLEKENRIKDRRQRKKMKEISRLHWENHERERMENKKKSKNLIKLWMGRKLEQLEYQTESRDAELREREHRHQSALSKSRKLRVLRHALSLQDERLCRQIYLKHCYSKHSKKSQSLKVKEALEHQSAQLFDQHVKEQSKMNQSSIQMITEQLGNLKHLQIAEHHRQRVRKKHAQNMAECSARTELLNQSQRIRQQENQMRNSQHIIISSEGYHRSKFIQKESLERIRYKKLLRNTFSSVWCDIKPLRTSEEQNTRNTLKALQGALISNYSQQQSDHRIQEKSIKNNQRQLLIKKKTDSNKQQRELLKKALLQVSEEQSRPVYKSRRMQYITSLKQQQNKEQTNLNWEEILNCNNENNSIEEYNELLRMELPSPK